MVDAAMPGARSVLFTSSALVVPDIPALVVPIPDRAPSTRQGGAPASGDAVITIRNDASSLILELDGAYVRDAVLPALASRHFAETDRYGVEVIDASGHTLLRRGVAGRLDPASADARAPLFLLRLESPGDGPDAQPTAGRGPGAGSALPGRSAGTPRMALAQRNPSGIDAPAGDVIRLGTNSWQVLVQHAAGSLDAAVSDVRRRNLSLNFGILAVLAAGVGLIVVNARRSERLAAQQMDFVATVSHELRTPVAVIRSAAQNLAAGVVHDPPQASRYGELIESEGRRLTEMVEQVLEYAGMSGHHQPVRAVPVDCGAVVRDVVAAHRAFIEAARITVSIEIAPGVPLATADEGAVRRALDNLIGNAVKHAADGRWLGVAVRAATARGRREIRIAVSDRGCGIASEDLAYIFEPFYRGRRAAERQVHGNGLGLSLVRRIAEAHGGRITVTSAGGRGATFTLHLPAGEPDAGITTFAEPAADGGRSRP